MAILLILWPLAELFVIVEVARAIGVLLTVVLVFAAFPLGAWALRSQGAVVWRRFADAVATGRPPGRHLIDGALVVAGGILLMIPGFITDAIGLVLLFPPSRSLGRGLLTRNLRSRFVMRTAGYTRGPRRPADVDSTAVDVDQRRLQR